MKKAFLFIAILCPALLFAQSLPTTGLTYHAKAQVDTDIWQVNTGGVFSDHPTDGEAVKYADDVAHGLYSLGQNGADPIWDVSTPLMVLPNLAFDGTDDQLRTELSSTEGSVNASNFVTVSAATMIFAIYVEAVDTNNAATYDNDAIISEGTGNFGLVLKNNAGAYTICYANFDGSDDSVCKSISINTTYVVMARHESGNIYISINGGAETSAASGNTSGVGAPVYIGRNYNAAQFYAGRIGELALWNVALTGTDLSDAIAYFRNIWTPSNRRCTMSLLGVGGC